jgi:glycogen synthase
MDAFAFASQTETQGIVLVEALAAGVPIVALDGPGVRDVVEDGVNGKMLPADAAEEEFAHALAELAALAPADREALRERARASAQPYAMPRCAQQALELYRRVIDQHRAWISGEGEEWPPLRMLEEEWNIWTNFAEAMRSALLGGEAERGVP